MSNEKTVLKFFASWCEPCKILSRTLAEVETAVKIAEIDIDADTDAARRYNIRGIPAMIMLDAEGNEIKRMQGSRTKQELEGWLNG